MTFIEMLRKRWQEANSMACVGLDSDYSQMGEELRKHKPFKAIFKFNASIVDQTHNFACAFKPNVAFYESKGNEGWDALRGTVDYIHETASGIPVILDAKRTDIGNTNKGYVEMLDFVNADAITVNPYFGGGALQPFLDRADKGVIILCRTSNKGAEEIQDLPISLDILPKEAKNFFKGLWVGMSGMHLYEYVAYLAAKEWNKNGNVLLVVGATHPNELKNVRKIVGDMPILVPGIGAQAGDLEATVKAGLDSTGFGMIVNSSRGIIFASKGEDFAEAAGRETKKLRDQINAIKSEYNLKNKKFKEG